MLSPIRTIIRRWDGSIRYRYCNKLNSLSSGSIITITLNGLGDGDILIII